MTLRELIAENFPLFYPQDWYWDEAFMDQPLEVCPLPVGFERMRHADRVGGLTSAATLCGLYVTDPGHFIWSRYLWTSDTDHLGQRVYIGDNGHGMEIHRHLDITERWGIPLWT